jgi:hypothetical protein
MSSNGNYVGCLPMPKQWLTYSALAERLAGSPTTARQQAIRARWPQLGYAKVLVDIEEANRDNLLHRTPEDAEPAACPTSEILADPPSAAGRPATLAADFETLKAIAASADRAFDRRREPAPSVRSANEWAGFQAECARALILEQRLAEAQLRADHRAELERQLAALRAKLTQMKRVAVAQPAPIRPGEGHC